MTLQASGAIKLSEIADEFLAPLRVGLSEMVRGGEYVFDSGTGYPNEDVPTAPPISMTSFYGAQRNPLLIKHTNEVILANGAEVLVMPLGATDEGIYVYPHDNSGVILGEAKFKVDVTVKMMPGSYRERMTGITDGVYAQEDRWMGLKIGLTKVNPKTSSNRAIYDNMVGTLAEIWYFYAGTSPDDGFRGFMYNYGFDEGRLDSNIIGNTDYADNVRPSQSLNTRVVLTRDGVNPNNTAKWTLQVYRRSGSVWKTRETDGIDMQYPNSGGWLVVSNIPWDTGNCDLDLEVIKAVSGGTVLP